MALVMAKFLIGLCLLIATLEGLSAQKETLNPEGCGVSYFKTMIVNGTEVKETQYPWVVFLELHYPIGVGDCGGTIITKRHVLTAAHCLVHENVYVPKVVVVYGSVDRRRGKKVEASQMLIHKDYNKTVNDIALLEVKYPFPFGKDVTPICLPTVPVPLVNKEAIVAGWGSLYLGGHGVDFLRQTTVSFLPDLLCNVIFRVFRYSDALQCCAQRRGKGACKGDSGGPVMIRNKADRFQQLGVVSYLIGTCGGDFNPQVYTRVNGYTDWLTRGVSSSAGYMPLGRPNAYMLKSSSFFIP